MSKEMKTMKNENHAQLNVSAFGLAGGIIGLFMGIFMTNGGMMYGGMMGYGNSILGFGGVGMAVLMGIVAALFAILYNWLNERMK